jgi:hypothetical protein
MSLLPIDQRVRLRGLATRPQLNGVHAIVTAADNNDEARELAVKRRVKVTTLTCGETLSVAINKTEPVLIDEAAPSQPRSDALFSTAYFAVIPQVGRGYTWQAQKRISAGKVLLREEPLLVHRMEDHMTDPLIMSLQERVEAYVKEQLYPPEVVELLNECAQRIADRVYVQNMSEEQRRRFMALSDAFSTPPAKTKGNVYRTNALSRADGVVGGVVYELLSRANHACAPNIGLDFEGFTVVVSSLRDVAAGEELLMSYISSDAHRPTATRREILKGKYNFICVCDKCGPAPAPTDEVDTQDAARQLSHAPWQHDERDPKMGDGEEESSQQKRQIDK